MPTVTFSRKGVQALVWFVGTLPLAVWAGLNVLPQLQFPWTALFGGALFATTYVVAGLLVRAVERARGKRLAPPACGPFAK